MLPKRSLRIKKLEEIKFCRLKWLQTGPGFWHETCHFIFAQELAVFRRGKQPEGKEDFQRMEEEQ